MRAGQVLCRSFRGGDGRPWMLLQHCSPMPATGWLTRNPLAPTVINWFSTRNSIATRATTWTPLGLLLRGRRFERCSRQALAHRPAGRVSGRCLCCGELRRSCCPTKVAAVTDLPAGTIVSRWPGAESDCGDQLVEHLREEPEHGLPRRAILDARLPGWGNWTPPPPWSTSSMCAPALPVARRLDEQKALQTRDES